MRHVKICKTLDDNQSKRVLVSSHQIFCSVNLTCVGLRNCVAVNMYDCFLDTLSQITMFDRYISSDCAGSVTTPNAIPTYQILSIKIKKNIQNRNSDNRGCIQSGSEHHEITCQASLVHANKYDILPQKLLEK